MEFSPEATIAVNDYVDRVRLALPLSPSARLAAVDRLYQDIANACAAKARALGASTIGIDTVTDHLASLGTTDQCVQRLVSQRAGWQWPGDAVAEALRRHRVHEKMEGFARVAAERGEQAARISIDVAANALDVAAEKLREAADRLKSQT